MKKSILLYAFMALFLSYSCSEAKPKKYKKQIVLISTDFGDMKIKLYDETPKHKQNFLKLADEGYYDGLLFHRVINNFMIQGGDPKSRVAENGESLGNGGPEYTLPAEFVDGLYHKKGALAAARLGDSANPQKRSSGSQFYVVHGRKSTDQQLNSIEKKMNIKYSDEMREAYKTVGGTPHLDGNYTVFGEVIEGFEVIDSIAAVKGDSRNRPMENIRMTVTLVKK